MTRHRERVTVADPISLDHYISSVIYEGPDCEGVEDQNVNSGTNTYVLWQSIETIDDIDTPDFFKRMKSGEIINNPLTQTKEVLESNRKKITVSWKTKGSGDCDYVSFRSGYLDRPAYTRLPYSLLPHVEFSGTSVEAKAVTDAWARVSASDANVLATLGELRETVASLVEIFQNTVGIIKAVKRLDLKALRYEISPAELAARYMEYRYALRPLFYDVKQYCKAFESICNRISHKRFTFRGKASQTFVRSGVNNLDPGHGYYSYDYEWSDHYDVTSRAGVLCEIDKITPPMVLGLTEPLQAGWELVPFSFVVDWFFNVGSIIASWAPNIGITHLASWVVTETTVTSHATITDTVNGPSIPDSWEDYTRDCNGLKISRTFKSKVRTPNPPKGLLPRLDINLDAFKLLDLAIILKQIMA